MIKWATKQLFKSQVPVASLTHFVVKLSLAAPESFLSAAALLHDAVASDAHFVMKLLSASFALRGVLLRRNLLPLCVVWGSQLGKVFGANCCPAGWLLTSFR